MAVRSDWAVVLFSLTDQPGIVPLYPSALVYRASLVPKLLRIPKVRFQSFELRHFV